MNGFRRIIRHLLKKRMISIMCKEKPHKITITRRDIASKVRIFIIRSKQRRIT